MIVPRMAILSVCPECGDPVDVVTIPPTDHAYERWQAAIECDTCDDRVFAQALEA